MWKTRSDCEPPLRRGVMTPQWRYEFPIICALMQFPNNRTRVRNLYYPVRELMARTLKPVDDKKLTNKSRPEPRFEQNMRAARKHLVEVLWLESTEIAGWGWWEPTARAKDWYRKNEEPISAGVVKSLPLFYA